MAFVEPTRASYQLPWGLLPVRRCFSPPTKLWRRPSPELKDVSFCLVGDVDWSWPNQNVQDQEPSEISVCAGLRICIQRLVASNSYSLKVHFLANIWFLVLGSSTSCYSEPFGVHGRRWWKPCPATRRWHPQRVLILARGQVKGNHPKATRMDVAWCRLQTC